MSNAEMSKSFYYSESGEYQADGFGLMGFHDNLASCSIRASDCRFQSLANSMICPTTTLRRRDGLSGTACSKATASARRHGRRSLGARPVYRHIPHRDKPPHLVARRNARERRRVQAVNNAFSRLRRHVPYENKQKRLSKVKTLRFAIDYINKLKSMLEEYDSRLITTTKTTGVEAASKIDRWTNERYYTIDKVKCFGGEFTGYNKRLEHYSPM